MRLKEIFADREIFYSYYKAEDGEYFKDGDNLYFYPADDPDAEVVVAEKVNSWQVLKNGNAILNYQGGETYQNYFALLTNRGRLIAEGGFSPDNHLVFVRGGQVHKQPIDGEPEVIIQRRVTKATVVFGNHRIHVATTISDTDLIYDIIYDYDGNLLEEETRVSLKNSLFEAVWYGLCEQSALDEYIELQTHYPEKVAALHETHRAKTPDPLTYEDIERLATALRDYDIISEPGYDYYTRLKDLFDNTGVTDIEKPLAVVLTHGQSGKYVRKNSRLVTAKLVDMLTSVAKTQGDAMFVRTINSTNGTAKALDLLLPEEGDE